MNNTKVFYEKMEVGSLYVFTSNDAIEGQTLLLFKTCPYDTYEEQNPIGYIPVNTPFLILNKRNSNTRVSKETYSYEIMWTNNQGEAVMGWIDAVDILANDTTFYDANLANTKDYNEADTDIAFSKVKEIYF